MFGASQNPKTPKPQSFINPKTGEVVSPASHRLRLAVDGSVVRSFPLSGSSHKPGPGGRRGRILRFSRQARARMVEHVNMYKRQVVGRAVFITLTYPGTYPAAREAKRHLDNFVKRLLRRFPDAGGVWRLEWQERGAPHFHLLIFGVGYIPWQWTAQAWYEVCGQLSEEHRKAGTETRRARSRRQALYYLSKYLAKTTQDKEAEPGPADDGVPVGLAMSPEQLAACVAPGVAVPGVTDANSTIVKLEEGGEVEGPGRLWGHFGKWREYQSEIAEVMVEAGDAARVARTLDNLRRAEYRANSKGGRRKVKRKKFVDRNALWYVNAGQIWKCLSRLVTVHVVPLLAGKAVSVSRPCRRQSDKTRDRRAFAWAMKQLMGLTLGVSLT
jgi:hypothetical protein